MLFGQKLSLMSSSVLQLTVGKRSKTVQFCKVLWFYTYIFNSCLRDPDSKAAKFVGMYSVSIICCVWLGLTVYQNTNIISSPFLKITAHCVPKVQSYKLQPPRKNQSIYYYHPFWWLPSRSSARIISFSTRFYS